MAVVENSIEKDRWLRYRQRNRASLAQKQRERYWSDPVKYRGIQAQRSARNLDLTRDSQNESAKRCKARIRKQIIDKHGGKCARCGFGDDRALQIDHVNGGGGKDRSSFASQWSYLRHVLADESGKFQILCANCNAIKRIEKKEHRVAETYSRNMPVGVG